ncbi:MAG: gephyrin-like molybdotransferase Glp [Chloroflexota bacterium]|nr:gephyrin-like molybdotransferase Glp [Chloroflexota bacterium]
MRESLYPMVPVQEALSIILHHAQPLPVIDLSLEKALGMVLAEDVRSSRALPPFDAAVVDGFALRVQDGYRSRRLIGEQMAGRVTDLVVEPDTAVRITTGAPLPAGADAVVKVEEADELQGLVTPFKREQLAPGLGIRRMGSDVQADALLLPAGTVLDPTRLGVVASVGQCIVSVCRRPVVGVFSTGDELENPGQPLGPGQVWDSNRTTLLAMVRQAGGDPLDLGIIRDRPGDLENALANGLELADLLVTSGGVSMGELDLLKPLLQQWGEVHFGRVLMKPGKPLTFATVAPPGKSPGAIERPVFALPGNPVSASVTFQLFVGPAIRRMMGHASAGAGLPLVSAVLGHPFTLDPERPEYHRVILQRHGNRFVARSTGSQASSRLLSITGAHGLLLLEQADGTLPAGTERPVLVFDDIWLRTEVSGNNHD